MSERKRSMAEVQWIDSCSTPGWQNLDNLNKSLDEHVFAECTTIGFVFRETDEYIALVMSYNEGTGEESGMQAENLFIIPRSCIKRVRQLRYKGGRT